MPERKRRVHFHRCRSASVHHHVHGVPKSGRGVGSAGSVSWIYLFDCRHCERLHLFYFSEQIKPDGERFSAPPGGFFVPRCRPESLHTLLHTKRDRKQFQKIRFEGKKWRRGWELNPHDTVLQTAPLAIRAPRLELSGNISGLSQKASVFLKKNRFPSFFPENPCFSEKPVYINGLDRVSEKEFQLIRGVK